MPQEPTRARRARPHPAFAAYAHPERLVSTEWLSINLGAPGVKVVESDEDVLLYDIGHIPGAVKIDWHLDLNDPVTRDYIDGAAFADLMSRKGISGTTRSSSTATRATGGRRTRCGCSRCSATRTCVCSTVDGTRGCRRIATPRSTSRHPPPPSIRSSNATTVRSGRSRTTSWHTWATARWSTSGRRRSTRASARTCPTTPRRARCGAATSRPRCRSRGLGPRRPTGVSAAARSSRRSTATSHATTTWSRTAASASARATRGSS